MEDVMTNRKIPALEKLATEEVGAHNSSLIFVTEEGVVRAVFTRRSDMEAAIDFAEGLPSRNAVIVEDHTGVAWENEESQRRQHDEEEEEED
jgi:hypothetical protein